MTVSDTILNEDDLREKLKMKQRSKIREFLDINKIPYLLSSDGSVVTTLSSFNMRLYGNGTHENNQAVDGFA